MLDGVTIRKSVEGDRSTLLDLWREAGGYCGRCSHPAHRKRWPKTLTYLLATVDVHVATMSVDDTEVVVGFAVVEFPTRETDRQILHCLFVRPECRKEGIAMGLWAAAGLNPAHVTLTHSTPDVAKLLRAKPALREMPLDSSLLWRHHDAAYSNHQRPHAENPD